MGGVEGRDGQLGRHQVVAFGHQQQERRGADVGQVGARFVLGEHLHAAQRHLVAPGRRPAVSGLGEPLPRVWRGQRRRGQRVLIHHGYHGRRLAAEPGQPVGVELGAEPGDEIGPDQRAQVRVPADQRHLAHHRLDPAVNRRDHQDMPAGVAAAPDPDPGRVHLRQRAGVGDGVPVVADLGPRIDLLTGLPVAGAEAAIVEDQDVQPGRCEHLGEAVQVHLLDRGEAVRHDHGRTGRGGSLGRVEPAAQGDAFRIERDIPPCHPRSPPTYRVPRPGRPRAAASRCLPVCEELPQGSSPGLSAEPAQGSSGIALEIWRSRHEPSGVPVWR
jgi:hypothetical protein